MPSLPISAFYFSLFVFCIVYWALPQSLAAHFLCLGACPDPSTGDLSHSTLNSFLISPQFINARLLWDSHIFLSSRAPFLLFSHCCSAFSSPGVVFNSPRFDLGLLLPALKSSQWMRTGLTSARLEIGAEHAHFPSTTSTWQKGYIWSLYLLYLSQLCSQLLINRTWNDMYTLPVQ